jgi:hypothetical protein
MILVAIKFWAVVKIVVSSYIRRVLSEKLIHFSEFSLAGPEMMPIGRSAGRMKAANEKSCQAFVANTPWAARGS